MADYEETGDWRDKVAADMQELLSKVVGDVLTHARAGCPVDTGHLRESLSSEIQGTTGRIGTELNYGLYVEEGHRVAYRNPDGVIVYTGEIVPPQPYLRPALYRKAAGL